MNLKRLGLTAVLVLAWGTWCMAQVQDNQNDGQGGGRGRGPGQFQGRGQGRGQGQFQGRGQGRGRGQGQFQRRGRRGGGPGFGPGFGGGPNLAEMTPEQRAQFYERAVNRQMDRLSQAYELDDTQKQQVRQRMEALRDEDMAGFDQRVQQMAGIRDQFRQLRQRSDAGEQIPREQWEQLGTQMRDIMRTSPLLNRERIMGEVEQVLPPEQAARGRERLQQQQAERERRWQDMRQQRERRQQEQNQNLPQDPAAQPQDPGVAPQEQPPQNDADNQDSERQRRREERQRRRAEGRGPDGFGRPDEGDSRDRGRDFRRRDQEPPPDPLGPWERYVRDFIVRYKLDASQQAVAQSVLRDLLAQRKFFEENHRTDIAIAQQVEDPVIRRQRLESINAPVVRMFDELKSKLERIPTAAQRQAVEGNRPTSRPAEATTQPARGSETRPARDRDRGRDRDPDRPRAFRDGPGRERGPGRQNRD